MTDTAKHLDEGVVDGFTLSFSAALHKSCVVGEACVLSSPHYVTAQVNHARNRQSFIVTVHADFVESADVEGEHKVVDSDVHCLADFSKHSKAVAVNLSADNHLIVGVCRFLQGEIVLVLDLAYILVEFLCVFKFFSLEL